jgi:hypothetical protein
MAMTPSTNVDSFIQSYIELNIKLAKTLVIKSETSANSINDNIRLNYGDIVDLQDTTSWKYYKNISGQYHPLDRLMTVTSLDSLEEIPFSKELWIEREDFMEDAPKKYFRMTPGQEVRLKNAYIVKCTGCKKDEEGNIIEVYAEYDPDTKSGLPGANRKVKGTIHWVSCAHCLEAEVRLYDRLWKVENPRDELAAIREAKNCDALTAMKEMINPDSLNVLPCCYIEKYAAGMQPLSYLQFQRIGYFNVDKDSTPEKNGIQPYCRSERRLG